MPENVIRDSRNFFVLPQGYEGGGYYSYGTPDAGRSQYAHPELITMIQQIAFRWAGCDHRKFGVGNISLANGVKHPDHRSHRNGLQVDIRLVRKDKERKACSYWDPDYDRAATAKLIEFFKQAAHVHQILFNDPAIKGVQRHIGHNDHFHVAMALRG